MLKGASGAGIPGRFDADPATVDQGLAVLVLGVIEPFRRLLEKQALRRIDAGSPTDEGIERMGESIVRLERKMEGLKPTRGLQDGDRNLNLGPPETFFKICGPDSHLAGASGMVERGPGSEERA